MYHIASRLGPSPDSLSDVNLLSGIHFSSQLWEKEALPNNRNALVE